MDLCKRAHCRALQLQLLRLAVSFRFRHRRLRFPWVFASPGAEATIFIFAIKANPAGRASPRSRKDLTHFAIHAIRHKAYERRRSEPNKDQRAASGRLPEVSGV